MKLSSNAKEREYFDHLAELFSIIKTVDALEKAYSRDAVSISEYGASGAKFMFSYQFPPKIVVIKPLAQS